MNLLTSPSTLILIPAVESEEGVCPSCSIVIEGSCLPQPDTYHSMLMHVLGAGWAEGQCP